MFRTHLVLRAAKARAFSTAPAPLHRNRRAVCPFTKRSLQTGSLLPRLRPRRPSPPPNDAAASFSLSWCLAAGFQAPRVERKSLHPARLRTGALRRSAEVQNDLHQSCLQFRSRLTKASAMVFTTSGPRDAPSIYRLSCGAGVHAAMRVSQANRRATIA